MELLGLLASDVETAVDQIAADDDSVTRAYAQAKVRWNLPLELGWKRVQFDSELVRAASAAVEPQDGDALALRGRGGCLRLGAGAGLLIGHGLLVVMGCACAARRVWCLRSASGS